MSTAQAAAGGNGKVTKEQAEEALKQLSMDLAPQEDGEVTIEQPAKTDTPPPTEPEKEEAPVEETPEEEEAPVEEPEPAKEETDDVASLRARIAQREKELEDVRAEQRERLEAIQSRNAQNEKVLRDRYLRKSTAADRALHALRKATEGGVVTLEEAEQIKRELEGTLNPASAGYVPPQQPDNPVEDQAVVTNTFLNEKGMTNAEAKDFGEWVATKAISAMKPAELAVAQRDLDGFLRLAHTAWSGSTRNKEAEAREKQAVQAARTIQRAQKEAARAASPAASTAPRRQPQPSPTDKIDWKKMSKKEREETVSSLLRMSVEQHQ